MHRRFILMIILHILAVQLALSQTSEQEAALKAVFIYNFTKYIQWDEPEISGNFSIGIIGNSAVSHTLEKISQNNRVNGKKIIIRYFMVPEEIEACNILFITEKLSFPLAAILEKTSKKTLTVSEEQGFAKMGTAFNFIIKDDKLKFEANLKVIYAAGVRVSSQLLKLATIVD